MNTRALDLSSKKMLAIGGVIVASIVLIGYYSSIKVGFLGDDWWFLGKAASLNLPDYLAFYFDPRLQIFWYRPLYGILLLLEYPFFGSTPDGYHLGQIALHAINCLLLLAIVQKVSHRWRLAILAALVFALLPVNNLAVFWIAVQDPLAMVFYLVAIWFWVRYLMNQWRMDYAIAYAAFILALLGKEASVFLPITLFLVDRLLIARSASISDLIRRYWVWGIGLVAYLIIEYRVQAVAYFPNRWGYNIGFHVVENLAHYLALSIFPWVDNEPLLYIILTIAGILLLVIGIRTRSKLLLFLLLQTLLTIAPAVAFPVQFFQARYLYFASTVTAVLFALTFETIHKRLPRHIATTAAVSATALIIVVASGAVTDMSSNSQIEAGRQMRVPLRDIYQQHPSYPPDTLLYFVEPPYPMIMRNLSGMFLLRYGTNVNVWSNNAEFGGVDEDQFANLRAHRNSFIYYFDDNSLRHEVAVDPVDALSATPTLPVHLQSSVGLEGYEVTASRVKSGADLVFLLYWQASAPIDRDYTVFVHLIDENGVTVFGEDSQPRGGRAPTTTWKSGKLIVDAHIVTMTQIPPGKYRLAVGMYDLSTQTPLSIIDEDGAPMTQQIIIGPIEVVK